MRNTAPVLVQTRPRNFAGNRVTVQLQKRSSDTAVNVANYIIAGGTDYSCGGLCSRLNTFSNRVELATGQMDSNIIYTVTVQNVRDAANSVSVANTPVNIRPGVGAVAKGRRGRDNDGGGLVTQWNDQSGFGNNALGTDGAELRTVWRMGCQRFTSMAVRN